MLPRPLSASWGAAKSVDSVYHDRIIDIDLLLCFTSEGEPVTLNHPRLTLPHPLMHLRDFVMKPLGEIAPELVRSIQSKRKEK